MLNCPSRFRLTMYLNKVRLACVLLPTIAIVTIYITASGRGYGRNLSAVSVKLPSVVFDGSVGGVGNQLFRYAFAYTLAAQLKTDLYVEVDSTKLARRTFDSWRREFVLDYFQIPFHANADADDHRGKGPRVRVDFLPPKSIANIPAHRRFSYTETNYQNRDPVPGDRVLVVEDYFESETFFAPEKWKLVNQFQFNPAKISQLFYLQEAIRIEYKLSSPSYADLLEDIRSSESVAIHFRIGDFTSNDHNINHVLPFSFQLRAIKLFTTVMVKDTERKELKFFVFSDDIDYVRAKVDFTRAFDIENVTANLVFVSVGTSAGLRDNSLLEFYLMTQCKHFIVPNSTYSWWAAYLSQRPGKKILAACPKNNVSYYDKYENLNVRAYKKMLGTNILYAYPRNWYTLNPFEAVYFQ